MKNNTEKSKFELEVDGHLAYASYKIESGVLFIKHVEAAPELRGKGAAGHLMKKIMEFVISKKLKVKPICGYANAWIRKHKEFHALLSQD